MKLVKEHIKLPVEFTLPASAVATRAKLLAKTSDILCVSTIAEQSLVVAGAREIRTHIKETEAARKKLAALLNQTLKRLMALKQEHCDPLQAELDRCEELLAQFDEQERKRVALEEQARLEAIERLEAQRRDAEEQARKSHDDLRAQQMAEMQAYEADQAARAVITAPLPAPARAAGSVTKTYLRHECTDAAALWQARPDLCNAPTARPSRILEFCTPPDAATKEQPDTTTPGLKLWWEKVVEIRSY